MGDGKKTNHNLLPLVIVGIASSVVVCIGFAAVLVLPAVQAMRESARRQKVEADLRELATALSNYEQLNGGSLGVDSIDVSTTIEIESSETRFVACRAILAEFEERYHWSDNWVENGRTIHDQGNSPRAVFVITQPAENTDRKAAVIYKYVGEAPQVTDIGTMFLIELPEDFLRGDDRSISNNDIGNLSRIVP
jgi:type II secretory pathway pseudopilin PulG